VSTVQFISIIPVCKCNARVPVSGRVLTGTV
jgi:hypothetical protein